MLKFRYVDGIEMNTPLNIVEILLELLVISIGITISIVHLNDITIRTLR